MLLAENIDAKLDVVTRATRANSHVRFDYRLMEGLRPTTQQLYRGELQCFFAFLARSQLVPANPQELDEAAVAYFEAEGIVAAARIERLLAAVEKVSPPCTRQLCWSYSVLVRARALHPTRHTTPMNLEVAMSLAAWMANCGWGRTAGVLLLQWGFGLRPNEALSLTASQLVWPRPGRNSEIVLLLAPQNGH